MRCAEAMGKVQEMKSDQKSTYLTGRIKDSKISPGGFKADNLPRVKIGSAIWLLDPAQKFRISV